MACNPEVGGLSGAFIPVSEDEGMIAAVQKWFSSLKEKLEATDGHVRLDWIYVAIPEHQLKPLQL